MKAKVIIAQATVETAGLLYGFCKSGADRSGLFFQG